MPSLEAVKLVAESVESTVVGRAVTGKLLAATAELKIGGVDLTMLQNSEAYKTSERCLDEINKSLGGLGTEVKQSVSGQLEAWKSAEPAVFLKDTYPVVLGRTADDREFVHAVLPNLNLVKDGSGSIVRLEHAANGVDNLTPQSVSLTTSGNPDKWVRTTNGNFTLSGKAFAPVEDGTKKIGSAFDLRNVLNSSGRLQPGTYDMNFNEFADTFATTELRQMRLHGMLAGLNKLQEGGVKEVDVFGSFVSNKGLANESKGFMPVGPNDFDLIFPEKGADMDRLQFSVLTWNKGAFGGDIFYDNQYLWDIDWEAKDLARTTREGTPVGVIRLHLDDDLPVALNFQKYPMQIRR
jgi:hypothetical protein